MPDRVIFKKGMRDSDHALIEKLNITSSVSIVIISISLMLFGGFAMTRITKRLKLPNVTAYIVAGILMGPYCLNLIPVGLIERMDFIADIALAFIAFSTGEFFRFSTLKKAALRCCLLRSLRRAWHPLRCLSLLIMCLVLIWYFPSFLPRWHQPQHLRLPWWRFARRTQRAIL